MSLQVLLDALRLPSDARVNQRIPKKLFAEQSAATAADRRLIQDGIEELVWFAALKPTTIGVAAYRDVEREYLEIAVLSVELRPGAKAQRIEGLIHRSVPYPVVLLSKAGDACAMSLAHKRLSQAETGKTVVERSVASGTVEFGAVTPEVEGFLAALDLAAQPARDLNAVYEGWFATVEALQAAKLTGRFIQQETAEAVRARRDALNEHARLERDIQSLHVRAAKEKQIARRVDLNLEIRRLDTALAALAATLDPPN